MYEDKIIKSIVKKVCDKCGIMVIIHPNGERAEGYSFIVTDMLCSWVVDELINAINQAYPDEKPLGTWRIQHGRSQLPCAGVKEDRYDECMELRLMWADYDKNLWET